MVVVVMMIRKTVDDESCSKNYSSSSSSSKSSSMISISTHVLVKQLLMNIRQYTMGPDSRKALLILVGHVGIVICN